MEKKSVVVRAGIEKFKQYSEPRNIKIYAESYGLYKVKHNSKMSELEACRAIGLIDGKTVEGWIINMANRKRSFKPDGAGYEVYPLKK